MKNGKYRYYLKNKADIDLIIISAQIEQSSIINAKTIEARQLLVRTARLIALECAERDNEKIIKSYKDEADKPFKEKLKNKLVDFIDEYWRRL